jgi:hypothetical protein
MHPLHLKHVLLLAPSLVAILLGCSKEDPDPPALPSTPPSAITTTLRLEHYIDGAPLLYDTVIYANEAGHVYSVSRLEYYISAIRMMTADCCDEELMIPGPFYINALSDTQFDLGIIPSGTYTGIELKLGLTPDLNITGALPNTMENVNMAWPTPMGGGYHFMKYEGHFLNSGVPTGFAMHLGRNENLPTCTATGEFQVNDSAHTMVLSFNLNEVFRTPHTYDLATGSYSMGSMMLMGLLRDNCTDAFTIEIEP